VDFTVELVFRVPLFHTGNAPALACGTADRSYPTAVAHLAFDIVQSTTWAAIIKLTT